MKTRERLAFSAMVLLLAATAAGCAPEPAAPTPSDTPTPSPSATSPSPTASPSPTTAADDIVLPGACEDIYSPAMLASLNEQAPPLNHPDVTMNSTQYVELLEILSSGLPTLRCSWGAPSEYGLATNVSIVDAAQSAAVLAALPAAGFECYDHAGGTICRISERTVTYDDTEAAFGETHYVRANGWVSTAWLNFAPQGYTEDIVATLWG